MVNLNPVNIVDEAEQVHAEILFDCAVDLCLIETNDTDGIKPVNLVLLAFDQSDRAAEERDLMTLEQEFLISAEGLTELGIKDIPERSKIWVKTLMSVELYEVVDDGGQNNFTRYDDKGHSWLIRTNRCEVLDLEEWTQLITQATN